jgi:hypothetical protein
MKRSLYGLLIIVVACTLVACSKNTAEQATATGIQPTEPAAAAEIPATTKSIARKVDSPAPAPPAPKVTARMFEVPEGTELTILLIDPLSSEKNKAGDSFTASIAEPIIVNGETLVDRGAKVQGRVVDAEESGRIKGRANIHLVLTSIVDGAKTYPIVTRTFVAEAESTKGRDAGIIAGGAGIGAAIGALVGGKKGALEGAAIGGAAGTGTALVKKGKEVEFGSETKLNFTLDRPAQISKISSSRF